MQKTVVINVVGLTNRWLGKHTPFLSQWSNSKNKNIINPVLPAVTCSAQSTYLTGVLPEQHGIVGNGWLFRDECEIKLWRQSNKLVQSPKLWEIAKEIDPSFTCANMFWWFNMNSTADYSVTPRPQYHADGRKEPDCYSQPNSLRERLQKELGIFPLFQFWGPRTTIKSSQWIADASILVDQWHDPTLTLIYLPHLDYCLQKFGHDENLIKKDLNEINKVCEGLIKYYESKGASVIILSEYGITPVKKDIALNRLFREHGLVEIREERNRELADIGASKAFAMADHQVAHIYINDKSKTKLVRELLEKTEGIELILDQDSRKNYGLAHDRSGELIAVSDRDHWFSYYYWLDDTKAPDFAATVEIHKKPGYDPAEMFVDPNLSFPMIHAAYKLMRKKMGFRYRMDLTPLNGNQVKGSHGRTDVPNEDKPIYISTLPSTNFIESTMVIDKILKTIFFVISFYQNKHTASFLNQVDIKLFISVVCYHFLLY